MTDIKDLVERIRQTVFRRHNVLLSESDPILATATICDETLSDHVEKFRALLAEHKQELKDLSVEDRNESTRISTILINRTLDAIPKGISQPIQQDISNVIDGKLKEFDDRMANHIAGIKQASSIATMKAYTIIAFFFFATGFFLRGSLFR